MKCPHAGLNAQLWHTEQLQAEISMAIPSALALREPLCPHSLTVLNCSFYIVPKGFTSTRGHPGSADNRLLPLPVDLNLVHACPYDSSSAWVKAPLPALPHCSFSFVHQGSPRAEGEHSEGTTHSQVVGGEQMVHAKV